VSEEKGEPNEMSSSDELPNLADVLARILQRIPVEHQPLAIALAERMAAERYRGWADAVGEAERRAGLLACAAREEDIARRVEALYPDAAAVQPDLLARHPELVEINRTLFAPYSLAQQFVLQARGERLGAATWRALARQAPTPAARDALLACALLEEDSAVFLESLA
jgi:hypothetical protein